MNTDFFAIIDETIKLAKTYIDEGKFNISRTILRIF